MHIRKRGGMKIPSLFSFLGALPNKTIEYCFVRGRVGERVLLTLKKNNTLSKISKLKNQKQKDFFVKKSYLSLGESGKVLAILRTLFNSMQTYHNHSPQNDDKRQNAPNPEHFITTSSPRHLVTH